MKYSLEQTKNNVKTKILTTTSMKELREKHSELIESLKKSQNIDWTAGYFIQTKSGESYIWIKESGAEVKI